MITCLKCGTPAQDDLTFLEESGGHLRMVICRNGHTEYVRTRGLIGRPRIRQIKVYKCSGCEQEFKRRETQHRPLRIFHSHQCLVSWLHRHRQKLPNAATLRRLYIEENCSTPQIAKLFGVSDPHTVRTALLKAGIQLRRRTVPKMCVHAGCIRPVQKIWHAKLGVYYGRLCKRHRQLHRANVSRWYNRRRRNIPPEKWLIAIELGKKGGRR